jgi:hypothetical protein
MANKRIKKNQQRLIRQRERAEREFALAEKEKQDTFDVRRRVKSGYNDGFRIRTINTIKFVLLISGVFAYFLYSVLLLPIVFLYGLTFFPMMKKQRNINYGIRKELHISLLKFDSLIALLCMLMVVVVIALSSITNGTKNSVFAGKNEAQIYAIMVNQGMTVDMAKQMASRMAGSSATLTTAQQLLIQAGTMLTGQRELFETKNAGATGFAGGNRPNGGARPNGTFTPPKDGNFAMRPPNGSGGFGGNRPITGGGQRGDFRASNVSSMLTDVFGMINSVLLAVIFIGGVVVCLKTNKARKFE